MENLPPELFRVLCENLGRDDQRSLRLTSRDVCAKVNPTLFESIDIFPFEESFEWVAANPEIQRHIRCVRYIPKILPTVQSKEKWWTSRKGLLRCIVTKEDTLDIISSKFLPHFTSE